LNFNPDFTQVAADGRPAGVKAVYGNATAANISYQDASQTILKLHHASDTSIGAGLPAIKINKDAQYRISFRVKSNAVTSNGFYFRVQELDDELEGDETHISNNAGGSESGVEEDTRQITFNGSDPNEILVGTSTENGPITTSFVQYEVLYTPTSTAKYFSPIFLNWDAMSTNELHIEKVFVQIDTSTKQQGTVGGWTIDSNAIYRGTELADDTFASSTGQITIGAGFIGAKEFKIASSGTATFKGTLSAPSGDIGGWTIGSGALTGGNVTLKSAGLMGISGSTTVGGSSVTTNILMDTDATKGSEIALQREDFGGDLTNFVELHTSQSYFENNIGSYVSGSTRDNKDFTRDANDSEIVLMSGAGAGAWASNVYLRSDGSDLDDILIENTISAGQLLDTGETNLITEIQLQNLTERAGAGTGKSLFRWKGEVFQNETNSTTGAELVGSFRISSVLSLSAAASSLNISSKFLLTKRYFYVKITGTDYDILTGSGVESWTLDSSGCRNCR